MTNAAGGVVDPAGKRGARRAGVREPAAGALGGAARLHARAVSAALAGVGVGTVDARRWASEQRDRLAPVCRELGLLAGEIGWVHRARGELQRAHEIETALHGELERIRARVDAERPGRSTIELDAETEGRESDTGSARARDAPNG